ncbi:MAG: polyprenyl synthetase family protein, partial [Defluviitoga tunisiensis]
IFGLSFSLPFFLAGEYKLGEKMHEIGIDFGISFQIFDDLKDLLKSEKELGKDTHKDVNKKTLLNKMSSKEVKIVADNYYSRVIENLLTLNYSDMVRNLIEIRNIVESR